MRRVLGSSPLLLVALTLASAVPGTADAATPASGAWAGRLSGYASSKLTFTVAPNHRRIARFQTNVVSIVCGGAFGPKIEPFAFAVGSATIKKSGAFAGSLVLSSAGGEKELEETVFGTFTSAKAANGAVTLKTSLCNVKVKFTARRK